MAAKRGPLTAKFWKRLFRKYRNRMAERFFDTRFGRRLLIENIGSRVLTMTVDCGDHIMSFTPGDYIGRKVFRKGHFERDHVDRLLAALEERQLLRKGSVLLEIGGNIGTQTVYFALNGAYRRIVAVEPDPRNFTLLETNIAQNALSGSVTLINCAAGDSEGEIDFFLNPNNHGKSSAIRQSKNDHRISVPVRPVHSILEEAGVSAEDVGLVWMDIEGYEPIACRSMENMMARKVPLHMEFTPVFYGPEQAAAFVAYLAGFYEDCLVFFEDRTAAMKVKDIPLDQDQVDVLFMR
jgi:FkbM family methyltransferase